MFPSIPNPPLGDPFFQTYQELPIGSVMMYAGRIAATPPSPSSAPSNPPGAEPIVIEQWGWMLCDGRLLKASEYQKRYLNK